MACSSRWLCMYRSYKEICCRKASLCSSPLSHREKSLVRVRRHCRSIVCVHYNLLLLRVSSLEFAACVSLLLRSYPWAKLTIGN
ncbi:hypothetical protein DAI22_11g078400 [Oryza sativa Japonica Group]|nr:hypothetical protein DAI22_11g078400 [Oryza sativa Japonica Group]